MMSMVPNIYANAYFFRGIVNALREDGKSISVTKFTAWYGHHSP